MRDLRQQAIGGQVGNLGIQNTPSFAINTVNTAGQTFGPGPWTTLTAAHTGSQTYTASSLTGTGTK